MSWPIPDSMYDHYNVANLNFYDKSNYRDENGWRLTKNIVKYNNFYHKLAVTNNDIGFERKYNGILLNESSTTSDSISAGSASTTEEEKYTEQQHFGLGLNYPRMAFNTEYYTDSYGKNLSFMAAQTGTFAAGINVNVTNYFVIDVYINGVHVERHKPIHLSVSYFYTGQTHAVTKGSKVDICVWRSGNWVQNKAIYFKVWGSCGSATEQDGLVIKSRNTKTTLPVKLSKLPVKNISILNKDVSSYSGGLSLVAPETKHYKSGYFVAAEDCYMNVSMTLWNGTIRTSVINTYNVTSTLDIYVNNVLSSSNVSLKAGDVVKFILSDTPNSYYSYDLSGSDYSANKYYQSNNIDFTNPIKYRKSFKSIDKLPSDDSAFIAIKSGTLSYKLSIDSNAVNKPALCIFKNGDLAVDIRTSKEGTYSVDAGDLILIRYENVSNININKYTVYQHTYDSVDSSCEWSFNSYTISPKIESYYNHYDILASLLEMTRTLITDNKVTDYSLPIAITDANNNDAYMNKMYSIIKNNGLNLDLWVKSDSIPSNDVINLCNGLNISSYNEQDINIKNNKNIKWLALCNFKNGKNICNGSEVLKSIELQNVSGDWSYAFYNCKTAEDFVGTSHNLTNASYAFYNCSKAIHSHNIIKNFFNDTYDMWLNNDSKYKLAFVNCPYNGTVLDTYMSINDQMNCDYDPNELMYAVLSQTNISIDPGLTLCNGNEVSWDNVYFENNVHYNVLPKDNSFSYEHLRDFYCLFVPIKDWFKWEYLFKGIKSLYKSCAFDETLNKILNYTLLVEYDNIVQIDPFYSSGDEVNNDPNTYIVRINDNVSMKSLDDAIMKSYFDEMHLHIGKLDNLSNENINLNYMFKDANVHCIACDIENAEDISDMFYDNKSDDFTFIVNGPVNAEYLLADDPSLKSIIIKSDTIVDAKGMCMNDTSLEKFDISGMTALKDATSMFENTGIKKLDATNKIPDNIETANKMFANSKLEEIDGDWLPPNSNVFMNLTEVKALHQEKDWDVQTVKEGWSFPKNLYSAKQMFYNTSLKKITNLRLHNEANNSWMFQDCEDLKEFKYSMIDIDTFDRNKYIGLFDGCSLVKENRIWLPISISSKFDLNDTSVASGNNEKPIEFWVDDNWCEVDNSGFIEYQHIRRPAYTEVYKKTYNDILIRFYSHIHIHSAELRGYNELHDTKVWYDPASVANGKPITYYTNATK